MTDVIISILDELLFDVGIIIESMVNMLINFTNSFMVFLLGVFALGLMWSIFLLFDIKRMEKNRLLRR